MDILDALSDLPEDYAALGLPKNASPKSSGPARAAQTHEGGITVKHTNESRVSLIHSKLGMAAAIAVCVGLNAALILGIISMKKEAGSLTPGASTAAQTDAVLTTEIQEITDGSVPELVGKDWETAKRIAKERGILLSKQNVDANGQPAGTVVQQMEYTNTLIFCNVASDPNAHDTEITFQLPQDQSGWYYIYLRDEQQESLGCSIPFCAEDSGTRWGFTADCPEPDTKAEAVLVNTENEKEAVIGSYILHQSPAPFAEEWDTFVPFDTVSEDIEAAFRAVKADPQQSSVHGITAPALVGKDWETAKRLAMENDFLLSMYYVKPTETDQIIGTVVSQSPAAGETVQKNARVVVCKVVLASLPPNTISFRPMLPANYSGLFYIYLRDEQQEVLGCSSVFKMDGESLSWPFAVECPEPEMKAEAVLVNAETGKEAVMGSYFMHCGYVNEEDTEKQCYGDQYDTVSADIEAAFKAVTE